MEYLGLTCPLQLSEEAPLSHPMVDSPLDHMEWMGKEYLKGTQTRQRGTGKCDRQIKQQTTRSMTEWKSARSEITARCRTARQWPGDANLRKSCVCEGGLSSNNSKKPFTFLKVPSRLSPLEPNDICTDRILLEKEQWREREGSRIFMNYEGKGWDGSQNTLKEQEIRRVWWIKHKDCC